MQNSIRYMGTGNDTFTTQLFIFEDEESDVNVRGHGKIAAPFLST